MKFAVISDVHANIYALEAALEDIEKKGIEVVYCTGDLVGYAPFPNEVIQLIRMRQIPTLQGNYDHSVGEDLFACGCDYNVQSAMDLGAQSLFWSREHTTYENKKWLRELPKQLWQEVEGKKVLFVHGSTRRNNEYLYEKSKELDEIAEGANFDILICGHTHKPFHQLVNDIHFMNGGSVGKPKHAQGDPRGTYIIVDVTKDHVEMDIQYVTYDYEKMAQAVIDAGLPERFAENLRGIL
ncbi:putative phosphoesterase [Anaerosolibacter carboniphilus]|uniref:Phosphoesterase n=1 Tax=Anaerosolibacter carboniphilus TaxID=1417629 RepID=A0A841KVW2_9FIRM|nr:metallophosphoesterase family protein [Anaerosolibacter carboniphilus]MBB6215052.1 putative phosphoesterase [Anaerosolibacter carboniphilus]